MDSKDFENYLVNLPRDEYNNLIDQRIARLNTKQQAIVRAREVKKDRNIELVEKLTSPGATEEDHQKLQDALRDGTFNCEHGRSYCKHCIECAEIDHTMFPELFDEDGEPID